MLSCFSELFRFAFDLDNDLKYNSENNCGKIPLVNILKKFDIMNLLEDRFKHASSSVVLATVKVFLHLTKDDTLLYK